MAFASLSDSRSFSVHVRVCSAHNAGTDAKILGEAKPGVFQTGGFATFFGKSPDCVADRFRTVPRRHC